MKFVPLNAHFTEEEAEAQTGSESSRTRFETRHGLPGPPQKNVSPVVRISCQGAPDPPTPLQGPPPCSLQVLGPCSPLNALLGLWPGLRVLRGRRLKTSPRPPCGRTGIGGGTEGCEYRRLRPRVAPASAWSSKAQVLDPGSRPGAAASAASSSQRRQASSRPAPPPQAPSRPTRPDPPGPGTVSSGWPRPQRSPPPAASGLG